VAANQKIVARMKRLIEPVDNRKHKRLNNSSRKRKVVTIGMKKDFKICAYTKFF